MLKEHIHRLKQSIYDIAKVINDCENYDSITTKYNIFI